MFFITVFMDFEFTYFYKLITKNKITWINKFKFK